MVGDKAVLAESFFDSMVLTKFSLKYIDAKTISSQIDAWHTVQKITLDQPYAIWIQGLP